MFKLDLEWYRVIWGKINCCIIIINPIRLSFMLELRVCTLPQTNNQTNRQTLCMNTWSSSDMSPAPLVVPKGDIPTMMYEFFFSEHRMSGRTFFRPTHPPDRLLVFSCITIKIDYDMILNSGLNKAYFKRDYVRCQNLNFKYTFSQNNV